MPVEFDLQNAPLILLLAQSLCSPAIDVLRKIRGYGMGFLVGMRSL